MGLLILGTFSALALGMGVGTFAAYKLGVHEAIGQLAGVALVGLIAVLLLRAEDRKRRAPPPPPPPQPAVVSAVTASAPTWAEPELGAATFASLPGPETAEAGPPPAADAEPRSDPRVGAAAELGAPSPGLLDALR
ncbi:MAG: hypothetical protein KDD82_30180 [Planctomycetes bacterium]|nr:hypothetical protein [Planctomycetota bacterium]